jgi:hypothetical protein
MSRLGTREWYRRYLLQMAGVGRRLRVVIDLLVRWDAVHVTTWQRSAIQSVGIAGCAPSGIPSSIREIHSSAAQKERRTGSGAGSNKLHHMAGSQRSSVIDVDRSPPPPPCPPVVPLIPCISAEAFPLPDPTLIRSISHASCTDAVSIEFGRDGVKLSMRGGRSNGPLCVLDTPSGGAEVATLPWVSGLGGRPLCSWMELGTVDTDVTPPTSFWPEGGGREDDAGVGVDGHSQSYASERSCSPILLLSSCPTHTTDDPNSGQERLDSSRHTLLSLTHEPHTGLAISHAFFRFRHAKQPAFERDILRLFRGPYRVGPSLSSISCAVGVPLPVLGSSSWSSSLGSRSSVKEAERAGVGELRPGSDLGW